MRAQRTIRRLALGLTLAASALCCAQDGRRREEAPAVGKPALPAVKLRAVALLEMDGKGGAVLTPLTIFVDGRIYDASIYRLTPAPFALQGGAVYEGYQLGRPRGLFTLDGARRRNDQWFGVGRWAESRGVAAPEGGVVAAPASAPARADLRPPVLDDPDKPRLYRAPGSQGDDAPPSPPPSSVRPPQASPSAEASPQDPDRPVLHRAPGSEANSQPGDDGSFRVDVAKNGQVTPARAPSVDASPADDGDRPRLHRAVAGTPTSQPPAARRVDEAPPEDPNRPRLHYGASQAAHAGDPEVILKTPVERREYMVAVSDAVNQQPLRVQEYQWDTPQQRLQMIERLRQLAAAELRRAAARYLPPPTAPKPTTPRRRAQTPSAAPAPAVDLLAGELKEEGFAAFDPDFDNSPLLIYEARWLPSGEEGSQRYRIERGLLVTLVYRLQSDAQPHRVFAAVSDPTDLDLHPELRFLDVVDLKGDGRAQLLFEQRQAEGRRFAFYQLWGECLREGFTTLPR